MADTEKKIATYICSGCEIGEALDMEALAKMAKSEAKADLVRTHPCLCNDEGLALIKKDIAEEGINTLVIAACSSRAKQEEFRFGDAVPMERVNLREGVAWVMEPGDEDTQWIAEDYIRMYTEKARRISSPEPFLEGEFYKDIMVVGGGIAGLNAALEAAKVGATVHLLEKSDALGGWASKLHKVGPTKPPYQELEDVGIEALIAEVNAHTNITVHLGAEIQSTDGGPCKFDVKLTAKGADIGLKIGAIILATGFSPYDANKLGAPYGYGEHKDVVTNVEFEQMAKAGELKRPSDGAAVKSVLFIQCAGSRDPEHLPYCSTYCCGTTLKQAAYLQEGDTDAQTYVLYKDMRTPGQAEEFYRQAQRNGTVFIRGELKEVNKPNGKLSALATDALLNDDVELADLDLVVLATGMVSNHCNEGETVEPLEGDAAKQPHTLKLNYMQGPEVPNLRYGSPDSHFICFPYETRRTGIYACGTVRRAMDMGAVKKDAAGAALKAWQAINVISRGEAVHPRALDKTYPDFFMQRCTQCKRCTEECPFGAINEDEKGNPLPSLTRCRRCGVCMGACPERIISFKNYACDQFNAMIKEIEVPDEDEEKPAVLAFICENDAYPVLDTLAKQRKKMNPYIRWMPLRCMGSMNLIWVAEALSKGIDGVLFFGCQHGEDYQCHFIKGSELCATRLEKVQETLDRLVLESERVRFEQISMTDMDRVDVVIEEFMETLEDVGPNPYKGF